MAYTNIQVKPIIAATTQNTQLANNDILFDWKEFDLPKGSSSLKNVTATIRHNDGAAQTMQNIHMFFARSINGVAPASLGTVNATADGTGYFNHIIGAIVLDKADAIIDGLDFITVLSSGNSSGAAGMGASEIAFSTDDFSTATASGYERYYVAAIHHGGNGLTFSTGVLLNETDSATLAALGTAALDVDGTDARKVFSVGDVIVAADGAAVGTVKSVPSDVLINLESAHTDALTDDDELLVQSPVGLQLSFQHD